MYRALVERDASFEGLFYACVRTTGIFCRPTCPARKPLPKNVEYFGTPRAALIAGYRPCKRCRPLELDEQPAWASALLAEVERDITEMKLRRRDVEGSLEASIASLTYALEFMRAQDQVERDDKLLLHRPKVVEATAQPGPVAVAVPARPAIVDKVVEKVG